MTTVSVGGLSFATGRGVVDEFGCRWFLTDLSGWHDTPGVRAAPVSRPGRDGAWDGPVTLDARVVAVQGHVEAPSDALLQGARDRLGLVLAGVERLGALVVDESAVSRQASVRLGGPTLSNRIGLSADFSLSLYAADGRRYGTNLHTASTTRYLPGPGAAFPWTFPLDFGGLGTGGRLQVFNAGTLATPPTLLLFGPLTNPRVTLVEQNRTVALRMSLALGQSVVIDNGVPSVLLGGSSRRQFLSSAQFFSLPPGNSTVFFDADDGAGSVQVQWRDAW